MGGYLQQTGSEPFVELCFNERERMGGGGGERERERRRRKRRESLLDWPAAFTKVILIVANCTLAKCSEEHKK